MIKHLENLGFTIVADPKEYHVDYKVYEIFGWDTNDPDKKPLWEKAGGESFHDYTKNIDEAKIYLHGFVKWDGCSNWHFDEQDEVMLHGCSREDLINIGEIMAQCWDWTKELCVKWDD